MQTEPKRVGNRLKKYVTLSLIVILFLIGCNADERSSTSDENSEENKTEPIQTEEVDGELIETNNLFGFELFHEVEPQQDNIFISPLSAYTALLLAYNGADGETKQEMAKTLHIENKRTDEVNEAMLQLTKLLQKDEEQMELSLANSIWLNDDYHFATDFSEIATNYFLAQHETIDIKDDASVDVINDWVVDATNGKITEMMEKPLSPDFLAVILNAIYFNGKWKYPFDEANTEEASFYRENEQITVPFMMLEEKMAYLENEIFQAVQLPYGSGEMSMQIYLPKENISEAEFFDQLTEENWTIWNSEFQLISGTIKLPKFQVEYETSLNNGLKNLGIQLAFEKNRAEFPNLIEEDERIYIHEVKQKTYIDVKEEGTEAAGVTSVEVRLTSAIIDEETFYMEVNRPFFFLIKDEETNAILFMGYIKNPKQGS